MKYIYIVKHYWDEKSYGAVIEPKLLFSLNSLSKEEKEIKEIVSHYLELANYNQIILEKPKYQKVKNKFVYFCYKDKNDPDPTNNRKVTDVTFIISPKKLSSPCKFANKNSYKIPIYKTTLYTIPVLVLMSVLIYFLFLKVTFTNKNENKPKTKNEIKTIKKEIKNNTPKQKITKSKKELMCEKYKYILTKNVKKCYEQFFYDICKKEYNLSYSKWVNNNECKEIIGDVKKDLDLKKTDKELRKFIERYPDVK